MISLFINISRVKIEIYVRIFHSASECAWVLASFPGPHFIQLKVEAVWVHVNTMSATAAVQLHHHYSKHTEVQVIIASYLPGTYYAANQPHHS